MVQDLVSLISNGWKNRAIASEMTSNMEQADIVKENSRGYKQFAQYGGVGGNKHMLKLKVNYERIKRVI